VECSHGFVSFLVVNYLVAQAVAFQMGFFDAPAFSSFFIFLGALCAKSVHIAIVTKDNMIKVYGDPQEGARVMGVAVARGKRRFGEHLPQSPLKRLTEPLGDMSEMCAKKAATACVAHMLGVTGKTLIKWGKVDALFRGTALPILNTKYIAENILGKYVDSFSCPGEFNECWSIQEIFLLFDSRNLLCTVWCTSSQESQNAALRTSHWLSNVSNNSFQKY
jgi:hypothetical protein